jgi:hypothetical protein
MDEREKNTLSYNTNFNYKSFYSFYYKGTRLLKLMKHGLQDIGVNVVKTFIAKGRGEK